MQRYGAANGPWNGRSALIDAYPERAIVPRQVIAAHEQRIACGLHRLRTVLRKGPALPSTPIERNVQCAIILSNTAVEPARTKVARREHAADECDQRQGVAPVITQRIDVPPQIATLRDLLIKSRSAIRQCAARRPESVAIGKPGPGCTLPPAR